MTDWWCGINTPPNPPEEAVRIQPPICACNWLVCQDIGGVWIHQNGEKCGLDKCVAANPAEKIVSLIEHIHAKGNQKL